jgi:hypothetical protein
VREMKNKILTGIIVIVIGAIAIGFFQLVLKQPLWLFGTMIFAYILLTIKNKLRRR